LAIEAPANLNIFEVVSIRADAFAFFQRIGLLSSLRKE